MANLNETQTWESGIYQIETVDRVVGGADGTANLQAKQLANRTAYLKTETEKRLVAADLAGTGANKGSDLVGHLPSGVGSAPTDVETQLRNIQAWMVDVRDAPFYAKGDGVTDDSGAIEKAIIAALAAGRQIDLGDGRYKINAGKSFTYAGDLKITGRGNAEFVLSGGTPTALSFGATVAATTTLASNALLGETSISVASSAGVSVGQTIHLNTATAVDSGYGYKKQSTYVVSGLSGTTVYLSEPLNFPFSTAETTVTFYERASLQMDGVRVRQTADKRFDLSGLQDVRLLNCEFEGYADLSGDVLFVSRCHGVYGKNLRLINGRYTINVSTGSRNLCFEDIYARNNRHPIDCNTWAFRVLIRRMNSFNTQGAIECHPCFEVHFEDCTDFSRETAQGGIGLRCVGGSVKRSRAFNRGTEVVGDTQSALLLSEFLSIGQMYDRVYEDVEAPNAALGYSGGKTLIVRRCKVGTIGIDGASDGTLYVSVDRETTVRKRMMLRRIPVLAPSSGPLWVTTSSSFASVNTNKAITAITKANPALVTAAAHGFSNGDVIRIAGVLGMTEVNAKTFTVANATADGFELQGVDSSAYSAYTSGGIAAKGRMALTVDPLLTPGLGFSPVFQAKTVLRNTPATLSPGTSITIPVKVVNFYDIQEFNYRHVVITVKAVSSTDGALVQRYQATLFGGSTSGSTLSAMTPVAPALSTLTMAISNLRHHYWTEVSNEGGAPATDAQIGEYYYSFDIVVTANATSDRVQYVELEVEEARMQSN